MNFVEKGAHAYRMCWSYFQVVSTDLLNWSDFVFSMTLFALTKIVKSVIMGVMRICYFTFHWSIAYLLPYPHTHTYTHVCICISAGGTSNSKLDNCLPKRYYSHTDWVEAWVSNYTRISFLKTKKKMDKNTTNQFIYIHMYRCIYVPFGIECTLVCSYVHIQISVSETGTVSGRHFDVRFWRKNFSR